MKHILRFITLLSVGCQAHAFYQPIQGRWLSRDPIGGEAGGVNLYVFVQNAPCGYWDILGFKRLTLEYDLAADHTVFDKGRPVKGFGDILEDVKSRVKSYSKDGKDPCDCVETLRIGGHGAPGQINRGPKMTDATTSENTLTDADFDTYERVKNIPKLRHLAQSVIQMRDLSKYMCEGGKLELVSCKTGAGTKGQDLQQSLEELYGKGNVTLHETNVKWLKGRGVIEVKDPTPRVPPQKKSK